MPRSGIPTAAEIGPLPGSAPVRCIFRDRGLLAGGLIWACRSDDLFAPMLAPFDPFDQQLDRKLIRPIWHASTKATWVHVLDTDQLGRDYLSRLLYGAQISLLIGVSAMLISGVIGTTLGVLAGYFGGRVDMIVSFIISTRLSLPVVLVALAVVAIIGTSLNVVIWVLGLLIWDRFAVVMRSATQQVRTREFITAAQAVGASTPRILLTEVAAQCRQSLDRGSYPGDGAAIAARSLAVLLRAWRSTTDAVLGPDGLRGQGSDVLRPLVNLDSRHRTLPTRPRHQHGWRRLARRHGPGEPQLRRP